MRKRRSPFLTSLMVVVIIGIGSRVLHTGFSFLDKYLGDALYAVMFYLILSLFWLGGVPLLKACAVMGFMTAIEMFQLTHIPLFLSKSGKIALRIVAIFLGTDFSWLDMLAYLIGIITIFIIDYLVFSKALRISKLNDCA